jgi:hypothetical protein
MYASGMFLHHICASEDQMKRFHCLRMPSLARINYGLIWARTISALRPLGPPRVSCLGATCGRCFSASAFLHPFMMSIT